MFNSNCASVPLVASLDGGNGGNGNNGNGMWGDWAWIIVFVLFFAFGGWGNGGWGGNNGGNGATSAALTRGDLCMDMNFSQLENSVRGIADGICSLGYDQLAQINGVNNSINTGFSNLNATICQQQYDTAQMINAMNIANLQNANAANVVALQNANAIQGQVSNCCCDLKTGQMVIGNQIERASCDTNYNAATNTNAIIQNGHNDTDRIIARLDAIESARKDETIAELRTKLASCGDQTTAQYIINQIRGIVSPTPVPAYPAASPCGLGNWSPAVLANGYGYGNGFGCGCNSGCACA